MKKYGEIKYSLRRYDNLEGNFLQTGGNIYETIRNRKISFKKI